LKDFGESRIVGLSDNRALRCFNPPQGEGAAMNIGCEGRIPRRSPNLTRQRSTEASQRVRAEQLKMNNALCTPHLGYAERRGYESMYERAVEQLLGYAEGAPINAVNPEAIGRR
jgi:hypothetical protein